MKYLTILLGALLALPAGAADGIGPLLENARVQASLQFLRADDARTLEEQIAITQIPAPTFDEGARARDFAARLRAAGLADVSIDAAGNVIGERKGAGKGPLLVLSAHLDTVFSQDTNLGVKIRDGRHYAPGIMDDARGLAALLSVLRAMQSGDFKTVGDVWFVGTVGEEALGNLKGVKALFQDHPHIDGFISVDGVDSPELAAEGRSAMVTQATGSRRWEISFSGPGGHSFENFGNPSAIHAMGRAIALIAQLRVPADPRTTYNVGVVTGGTGVTAIASEAMMRVDMRSNDATELQALQDSIQDAVNAAVRMENGGATSQIVRSDFKLIGDRPASTGASDQSLVNAAVAAHVALNLPEPLLRAASTDSNVPLGLGIPAATMHGGGLGDLAHSHDEWYEHKNAWLGPQVILLTTLRLTGVRGLSKPALAIRPRLKGR